MSLEVINIDINNNELISSWDEFVDLSPEGTFYHKSFWILNNISKSYKGAQKYELYYIKDKNNNWIAAFYVPYSKKLLKQFIVMPHMTPYGGVMYAPSVHKLTISKRIGKIKELNELFIKKLKEKSLLYYAVSPENNDMQNFIWNSFVPGIRYTYRVKLQEEAILWSNLQEKTEVNKGKKLNISVKWGFNEYIDLFFELNNKSFEKQGVNNFDNQLTKKLLCEANKNNSCKIGIIYDEEGNPLGGCVLAYDNKRSYYIMGGISRTNNFAMSALLWEAMLYSKNTLKVPVFDFEGSMIPSIERYFRKFGGELIPYYTLNSLLLIIKNKLRR